MEGAGDGENCEGGGGDGGGEGGGEGGRARLQSLLKFCGISGGFCVFAIWNIAAILSLNWLHGGRPTSMQMVSQCVTCDWRWGMCDVRCVTCNALQRAQRTAHSSSSRETICPP